ncbi:site-specific integrase (plasmid) [Fervidibacter sacchari]|uniref:Integrase n=1 Tax=Candidatus Fervidibacter sacchari TaxID=1448929 RepID=A0ABT2ETK6_9BACT|nr:site-specific integrase [Candidatus Fervidibacter sacchari]MCS3921291.1 integrase [Candidatus Fervidibacter sacchari]WKU18108.1 site-specific integrase [Candidatus Fervidibacter sacchari]
MGEEMKAIAPISKVSSIVRRKSLSPVPYLRPDEVSALIEAAKKLRYGERNALLIKVLYQCGLRISEALSLTPSHLTRFEGIPCLRVKGKGGKERLVHVPENLYSQLLAYAYQKGLKPTDKFFNLNRKNAHKMLVKAAKLAGLNKRVYPHLLRHSCAIERLRQTGNPKALQWHLGHNSMAMTMRYLATLTMEEALKIQAQVKFED